MKTLIKSILGVIAFLVLITFLVKTSLIYSIETELERQKRTEDIQLSMVMEGRVPCPEDIGTEREAWRMCRNGSNTVR